MKPTVLITGGAGYIGSHTAYLITQKGYEVIIIDSFEHGQSFNHTWATCITSDFANTKTLKQLFETRNIEAVMHFAAFIEVGKSVKSPLQFYENLSFHQVARYMEALNIYPLPNNILKTQ